MGNCWCWLAARFFRGTFYLAIGQFNEFAFYYRAGTDGKPGFSAAGHVKLIL